jgi:hypothetical protein
MRVFLSHSSADKHIVEPVAQQIGLANCTIDSKSFEYGLLNSKLIENNLKQNDLFVLFLSKNSLLSNWVKKEIEIAEKYISEGRMRRFLTICIDDSSLSDAMKIVQNHNAVRKVTSVNQIVRIILTQMISANAELRRSEHIFIGRKNEIEEIQNQIIDPTKENIKSIFISGIAGIGRRSFVRQIYKDVYPSVNRLFPEIFISPNDGSEEIFRKLIEVNTPIESLSDIAKLFENFSKMNNEEKINKLKIEIYNIFKNREALVFTDAGGLLNENGSLNDTLYALADDRSHQHHPGLIFISERMMPFKRRTDLKGVAFQKLQSLRPEDSKKILAFLLKKFNISYTSDDLEAISEHTDNHPQSIYITSNYIKEYGINQFLNDPSDLVSWKHRRGYEYLIRFEFSDVEKLILGLLSDFKQLDASMLFEALGEATEKISTGLKNLLDLHIIEIHDDDYVLAPPQCG